ncbi:hypothetical protein quinque_015506 [Culex quinquefasciatus]
MGTRFDDNRLTLRIHRGRGSTASAHGPNPVPASVTAAAAAASSHESPHSNGSTHSTTTSIGSASPERLSRYSTRCKNHEKIKISVSYPSTENLATGGGGSGVGEGSKLLYAVHYSSNGGKEHTASQIFRRSSKDKRSKGKQGDQGQQKEYLTVDGRERSLLSPRSSKRMGKRNIKAQVKRFRMETKAAKTLAIIVGLFILCWLPFFTMYLVRPFCEDCINETLFSILFWLGYCNSAINPMIYALFSKDFRFAFKRLICRFFCSAEPIARPASRRGSDMSQIRGHHGSRAPSISPSAAAQSLGEDSDPMMTLAGDLPGAGCRKNSSISTGTGTTSGGGGGGGGRVPVYDICHPLVMEGPGFGAYGSTGGKQQEDNRGGGGGGRKDSFADGGIGGTGLVARTNM